MKYRKNLYPFHYNFYIVQGFQKKKLINKITTRIKKLYFYFLKT